MEFQLSTSTKILFISVCFGLSIIGFMIKLPSAFRHIDKELHSLFYFCAAVFLNLLFVNRNFSRHVLVFIILYFIGISIEHAQAYSNKLFHVRIHGRYDPEDVLYNLYGLIACSMLWFIYTVFCLIFLRKPEQKD